MKKKIIIITSVILLILIGYKVYALNKYKSEYVELDTSLIFNETITINEEYDSNDIVAFGEMTYNNFFSDYVEHEESGFKVKYDENNEVSSFYSMFKEEQYINVLNVNSFLLYADDEDVNEDISTENNMKKFLDKNNIKDDIDFLKYVKENYYIKNNIFTSTSNMRNHYIINSFVSVAFPEYKNIVLIDGNVKGYIINAKSNVNIKEIHLLHNTNQYIITLSGDEIANDEFVNNFLKSVKFN